MQGFNMIRAIQGAKTLSLPMQMLGADLQGKRQIAGRPAFPITFC